MSAAILEAILYFGACCQGTIDDVFQEVVKIIHKCIANGLKRDLGDPSFHTLGPVDRCEIRCNSSLFP